MAGIGMTAGQSEITVPTSARKGNRSTMWATIAGGLAIAVLLGVLGILWAKNSSAGHGPPDLVARFLFAVAVVLVVCHSLGALFVRMRQPQVVGEILGGLLLGPSALGLLWPAGRDWLFPVDVRSTMAMAAQLGLVTFMFLLGTELRMTNVGAHRRALVAVCSAGMLVPFVAGFGLALAVPGVLGSNDIKSAVFIGLAVSITAVPVLARLLGDLRLEGTLVGNISLSSAVIGDGVAWGALTVILAASGMAGTGQMFFSLTAAIVLVLIMVLGVRRLLVVVVRWAEARQHSERFLLPLLVAGAIGTAAITQQIGLHPVIGAFLFGTVVPRHMEQTSRQMRGFAVTILLPLFFAGIGMQVSVGLLGTDPMHWLLFAAVLVVAVAAKFAGAGGSARLAGLPGRQAWQVGALMNCRGVTELIIASIGYQAHLINQLGMTVFVLMALITTAITGPLARLLAPREFLA
jgi:Kef-type K+ transport system membrane component KefB